MSAIEITVKSSQLVEIRAENDDTLSSRFQDFYRNPGPRMRLAREISDLVERYTNEVEGQVGGRKKEGARKKIISDLALLGQKTAQDIFGEDWAKIGDLLQRHSGDEIWVRNGEYVWIPWELLCHFPNRAPSLDSFIASRRNVYRVSRGSRNHGITIPIAEAGLLAHLEWSDKEGAFVEQVKSPCIEYSKHEMQNPEDRVSALQHLIKWLASMDIIHIGGIIVPLQHQDSSWLLIDRDFHLCIEDLYRSSAERPGFRKFDKKPLVILNMRDNYYRDPQQVLRYIRFFLQSDAIGVIASELPIPTQLALEFSEHFYRNLSQNGRSLGQILTATKSYLIERGNPFAMFYAPYFHPNVKLELEEEPVPPIPVSPGEKYTDFALHIGPGGHARAVSDEGQRSATISLDIPEEVKLTVDLIELDHTNADLLKNFGKLLYQIIFPAAIDKHFNQTEAVARSKSSKVRIRLTIEPDPLARLPWEFLYREERGYFLATDPATVLSHYLDLPLPSGYVRQGEGPLHMLTIISSPTDQPRLNVDRWDQIVRHALSKPLEEGQLTLQTVRQATFENIKAALLGAPPDIVQFVGHGVYQEGKGYLALVGENGETWTVDDERFAAIFAGVQSRLGLICLATCESAKSDSPKSFLGIAPQLVQRGTPAVVAMRYPVLVSTAEIFLESFYKAVAARKPVDWAVQWARNAISIQVGLNNRDFATPVLFMRARDGKIF